MNENQIALLTTYWLNLERLDEAKCCHHLAIGNEAREFKGIEVVECTPLVKATSAMYVALQLVAAALDTYEAPPDIVAAVTAALAATKCTT